MKTKMKLLCIAALIFVGVVPSYSQGYIVPNGVVYSGYNPGFGYEIDVLHDPTNSYYTGFGLDPMGKTLPTVYTNTFRFGAILDVSVRVFLVASNQPVSLQAIQSGSYTELMFQNYVLNNGSPFYVGLYTGNQNFYPPGGIYTDPLFGWARLVNNQGVIQLLDSALVYKAEGIFAGTQTIIPEPTSCALIVLSGALLGIRRCKRLSV
ncbi:MAG: PEP-CTERM sorting domain-containing protein [Verrucomicrobiae bacterium]|nr:PEP-CTERM sorting domain-containing protein [Verrucomicrobiae bacterium]